jgi:heme exporter protein CcmD
MSDLLRMGGYAAYVWPCFLLAGVVLAWNILAARRLHAQARASALKRAGIARDAS